MFTLLLYAAIFAAGLIVGWNFLPQPEVVKNWVARVRAKFNK